MAEKDVPENLRALQAENAALKQRVAILEQHEKALHKRVESLRTLLDALPASVFLIDREGIIQQANAAIANRFGIRVEDLLGRCVYTLIPPDAINERKSLLEEAIQQQHPVWHEEKRDGRYIASTIIPIVGSNDTIQHIAVFKFDVTDRVQIWGAYQSLEEALRKSEERLRANEERYRILVETSPSAIILTDLDGTIRFCNGQAAALFGYASVDDLQGKNGSVLISTNHMTPDPLIYVQRIIKSGNLRNIQYTMRRCDGGQFPAEVSSSVVTDSNGYPTALILVVQDVSERKLAEQSLITAYDNLAELNNHVSRSRNLLQAIFDGLGDGLLLLDGAGCVQLANKALAALFNKTPDELVGQKWSDLCAYLAGRENSEKEPNKETTSTVLLSNTHAHTSKPIQSQRVRYHKLDGTTCILDLQTIALYGSGNNIEQTIVHVADVTEHTKLQARVIENERFAASGRMVARVAHEINTPLQSLQTSLELAQIASDEDRNTFLAYALEEIQRVGRIVLQLLDLYRSNASTHGPVDINILIERLLLLIGKRLSDQNVQFEPNLAPDLPAVQGRADELMQIFLNLMVNALDAMPEGGHLYAQTKMLTAEQEVGDATGRTHTSPASVMVTITDTGCGISPELQEHIFDPFVTSKAEGTGLGLSISKQIVQKHHGSITVESQLGKGSTFTVILPLTTKKEQRKTL